MDIKVGRQAIAEATEKLKNWGRWGKEDQIGTLNHVTPEDIVKAARLIRTGKVFALGIPLDSNGPQTGLFGGRFNPIHQMLATGTDAVAGRQDWNKIRYADDTLNLCVQGATHWDALGHIFYEERAYNGYDAKLIDAKGLNVLGIEHSKSKMVGRGVLLDIARFRGVDWLNDGEGISNDELDRCAKKQKVAATSSSFALDSSSAASRKRNGAAMPAATRPASSSRTATGARTNKSRPSAPIPGESKCGRTRPRKRTSPGIGWSFPPWGCAWVRSFISRNWRNIVPPTVSTSSSSADRR
jgi:hypothetical protein